MKNFWKYLLIFTLIVILGVFGGCTGSGGGRGQKNPAPEPLKVVIDSDGDGVADFFDDYPLDPSRDRYPTYEEKEVSGNTNDGVSVAEYKDNPIEIPARLIGNLRSSRQIDMDYWKIFIPEAGSYSAVCRFEPGIRISISIINEKGEPVRDDSRLPALPLGVDTHAVNFRVPQSGDYYLVITDVMSSSSPNNNYEIKIFPDSDGDYVPDDLEIAQGSNPYAMDTDQDGLPDGLEFLWVEKKLEPFKASGMYSEEDFIKVAAPQGKKLVWLDLDSDANNDGILDRRQYIGYSSALTLGLSEAECAKINDSDGDGTPNFVDEDCDGNGIPNSAEIGPDPNNPIDTDGDGIPDYLDLDDDGDGLLDIHDNDRLVPVGASGFILTDLRNSTRSGINNIAVPGDTVELIGMSISEDVADVSKAWVVIRGAHRKDLVNLRPEGINSDENIYFVWPDKFEPGNVEVVLIYDYKRTTAIGVKNAAVHEPIVYSAEHSGNNVIIRGVNLSWNFDVVFDGATQTYNNSTGRNDTFSIAVPQDAQSGPLFLRSANGDSNVIMFEREIEIRTINGTINMPRFNERFSNLHIVSVIDENPEVPNNIGVINNIKILKDKPSIVSVFYVENGEYCLYAQVGVLPSDTSVTINMDNIILYMLTPFWTGIELNPSQKVSILALPAVQALKNHVENGITADPKFFGEGFLDNDPFNGRLRVAMEAVNSFLESIGYTPSFGALTPMAAPNIIISPSGWVESIMVEGEEEPLGNEPGSVTVRNKGKVYATVRIVDGGRTIQDFTLGNDIINPSRLWRITETSKTYKIPGDVTLSVLTSGNNHNRWEPHGNPYYSDQFIRNFYYSLYFAQITDIVKDAVSVITPYFPQSVKLVLNTAIVNALLTAFKEGYLLEQELTVVVDRILEEFSINILKELTTLVNDRIITQIIFEQIKNQLIPWKQFWNMSQSFYYAAQAATGISNIIENDSLIDFELRIKPSIDEVIPKAISKYDNKIVVTIKGNGFGIKNGKEPDIHIYDNSNKNLISSGKPFYLSSTGTQMQYQFVLPQENELPERGWLDVIVWHPYSEVESERLWTEKSRAIEIREARIDGVTPNKGRPEQKVMVYGSGLLTRFIQPKSVAFESKSNRREVNAEIWGEMGSSNEFLVEVPPGLENGDYLIKVSISEGLVWRLLSITPDFTVESDEQSVFITVTDNGNAKDDAFALFVNGRYIGTMYANNSRYTMTWEVKLNPGQHNIELLGIEAPDMIGTYGISFRNATVVSGASLIGTDLVPGVRKRYIIQVDEPDVKAQSAPMRIQSRPYEVFSTQNVEAVR